MRTPLSALPGQPQPQTAHVVMSDASSEERVSNLLRENRELRTRVRALSRENDLLQREKAVLSADAEEMKQMLFTDTTAIVDLDQQLRALRESLEDERRMVELSISSAVGTALAKQRKIHQDEIAAITRAHDREVSMLHRRQKELQACYEKCLAGVGVGDTAATARRQSSGAATDSHLTPTLVVPAQRRATDLVALRHHHHHPHPPGSPAAFDTLADRQPVAEEDKRQQLLPPLVECQSAQLSVRLESVEHDLVVANSERAYAQEQLNATLAACRLDSIDGLRELWRALGGTTGWRDVISPEALSSILGKSNMTAAWLAASDSVGWCGQPTGFVPVEEVQGFVSVVLARLPGLTSLGVHAARAGVFDWNEIDAIPYPFPALRCVLLSAVPWNEEAVLTMCRKMETYQHGDYLDDVVLDPSMAPRDVNFAHLRRTCHAVVGYFTQPITSPLRVSLPKLVWHKMLAQEARTTSADTVWAGAAAYRADGGCGRDE